MKHLLYLILILYSSISYSQEYKGDFRFKMFRTSINTEELDKNISKVMETITKVIIENDIIVISPEGENTMIFRVKHIKTINKIDFYEVKTTLTVSSTRIVVSKNALSISAGLINVNYYNLNYY